MQAGAWVVVGIAFAALFVFTALLLRNYASRDTHAVYWLAAFVSWFLGFAGTLLLPADIANAVSRGPTGGLFGMWQFIFWTTFTLSWIITPVLMEYWAAGHFTAKARLLESLRANLKFYLVAGTIVVAIGIWVIITEGMGPRELAGFLIAAANTWGLLLIVLLLGYGLVELPRTLWRSSLPEVELRRLEFRASVVDSELFDAEVKLSDVIREVQIVRQDVEQRCGSDSHLRQCMAEVVERLPADTMEDRARYRDPPDVKLPSQEEPSKREEVLARLNHKLRVATVVAARAQSHWDTLIERAAFLEAVINKVGQSPPPAGPNAAVATGRPRLLLIWDHIAWVYRMRWSRYAQRVLAVLCGAMSLMVLWCEVTMFIPASLSVFGAIIEAAAARPILVLLLALLPLTYVSVCLYRALFHIKLPGVQALGLYSNGHTDPYSLLFNAAYLCRLQFSLGFHYLMLLQLSGSDHAGLSAVGSNDGTAFRRVIGAMDVVPVLGSSFNVLFPLVMLLVCVLVLFNVFGKLVRWLGVEELEELDMSRDEHRMRLEDGKRIIHRGRRRAGHFANGQQGGRAGRQEEPAYVPPVRSAPSSSSGFSQL